MREKQGYRDTLAELNALFPDKGVLSKTEAARFMGVSIRTIYRMKLPFNQMGRIAKADLARFVCN